MKLNILAASLLLTLPLIPNTSSAQTISPTEDVITSAFFQGTDLVRGYAGDNRPTLRVSSDNAFGFGPEQIYVQFSAVDIAPFTNPVSNASLSLTSVTGNFGADASATSPFIVSAHAVNANPFTSIIDDTNPQGTTAWDDFFANNIFTASPEALTVVDGFGVFDFDVTDIVNDWISGSNQEFVIALTGTNDVQIGDGFLHGFSNNTEAPGSTFLTVSAVPEPSSAILLALPMAFMITRRHRS